jgi:hypothetical protein
MTRAFAVTALAATLVARSDSRGDGISKNSKAIAASESAIPVKATAPQPQSANGQVPVQRALDEPADFNFVDTPLKDVADFIADHFKISVMLDEKSLNDAGVTVDTTITEAIRGVPLRSALYFALASHDLAWTEKSADVLAITTAAVAKTHVVVKVYDVREFVEPPNESSAEPVSATQTASSCHGTSITFSKPANSWDGFKTFITSIVTPASWSENGGAGSLSIYDGNLVVAQTEEIQSQVAKLLISLDAALHQDPSALKDAGAPVVASTSSPDARIDRALDSRLAFDFTDVPLKDVADYLQQKMGVPVQLDIKALADAGITPDTTLTLRLKNAIARVGLRALLDSKGMDFVVDHEVLLFTVSDTAAAKTVIDLYPVGDLIASTQFATAGADPYDALVETITVSVRPSSWNANGGFGSIAPLPACKVLAVSANGEVQREINELLSMIRSVRKNETEAAAAPNNSPVLRVYWLPWDAAECAADEVEGQRMVEMVRKLASPKSWANSSDAYIGYIHGALVVRQTPDVQQRILAFIAALSGGAKIRPAMPKTAIPPATPAVTPKAVSQSAAALPESLPITPSPGKAVAPGTH